jgi:hypothetical protein
VRFLGMEGLEIIPIVKPLFMGVNLDDVLAKVSLVSF